MRVRKWCVTATRLLVGCVGSIYAQVFLLSARYTLSNKLSARLSVRVENHLCWLRHSFTRSAGDKRRAATLGVLAEPVGGLTLL